MDVANNTTVYIFFRSFSYNITHCVCLVFVWFHKGAEYLERCGTMSYWILHCQVMREENIIWLWSFPV